MTQTASTSFYDTHMRQHGRISVREATVDDAPGIAQVHVDSWRTTYEGIVPARTLARLSYLRRESLWREILSEPKANTVTLVAVDEGGRVVGFANAGPGRDELEGFPGELYAVYLLLEYQGQGIGTMLVRNVVAYLLTRKIGAMYVWVLTANPARRFYRALGGVSIGTKDVEIGGEILEETAYGWADISAIEKEK